MQRFGIEIIPINIAQIINRFNRILMENDDELEEIVKLLKKRFELDANLA
jgi:hypothetical protein